MRLEKVDGQLQVVQRALDGRTASMTATERSEALDFVVQRLAAATDSNEIESLTMLSFRLGDRSPFDPEVQAFIQHGMQRSLAGRDTSPQSQAKHFNPHDARSTLIEAKNVFDRHGKRFFLDRGTLLGAVREGGFIASDYDIDVGVFADDVSLAEIKEMFAPTDFELNQDFEFKVGLTSPSGIQVDFFLTTREKDYFLSKGFRSIHNWYFSPFELVEFEFLGEAFYIPDNYEKHLDENYGNWRYPAIFYDLSYNEPCVAYGKSAQTVGYLTRRMADAVQAGSKYLAQMPASALRDNFEIDYTDWFPQATVDSVHPVQPSHRSISPIVVVDVFERYLPRMRRIVESALSITSDLDLCVIEADATASATTSTDQRRVVAGAIDRVRQLTSIPNTEPASLRGLLRCSPQAIVFGPEAGRSIDALFVQEARSQGCEIVVFNQSAIALTLDQFGQVVARQPPNIQRTPQTSL